MMMNYEEFKKEIMDRRDEFLTPQLANAELYFQRTEKMNGSYNALVIHMPGDMISASVNLDRLYENNKNRTINDMIEDLRDIVSNSNLPLSEEAASKISDTIFSYEDVKKKLFIRCNNREKNADMLEHCPYIAVEDLAVTAHVGIDWSQEHFPSCTVTIGYDMFDRWGVSKDTLFMDAIQNSVKRLLPQWRPMAEVVKDITDVDIEPQDKPDIYVLSNSQGVYGSGTILYPDLLKNIHEQIGNYYMLPSSIHEWLLLPESSEIEISYLEDMVRSINKTEVKEEDFLSDEIYHFDGKKMELARQYERRMEIDQNISNSEPTPDTESKSIRV